MAAVKALRTARGWSADRLAEAMTAAGVPWTRDAVVNLETGRRKRLAVHELLALAYVLDIAPAFLISGLDDNAMVPVTPQLSARALVARNWMVGFQVLPGTDEESYVGNLPVSMRGGYARNVDEALAALDGLRDDLLARQSFAERLRGIREDAGLTIERGSGGDGED